MRNKRQERKVIREYNERMAKLGRPTKTRLTNVERARLLDMLARGRVLADLVKQS